MPKKAEEGSGGGDGNENGLAWLVRSIYKHGERGHMVDLMYKRSLSARLVKKSFGCSQNLHIKPSSTLFELVMRKY